MSNQPVINEIESLLLKTKEYAQNRFDLYKLKAADKTASVASAAVTGIALFIVFFIFFIVLNIGIALLIGSLIGRAYWGFLILAAVYLIIGLVIFSMRNKLFKNPIASMIFRKFL